MPSLSAKSGFWAGSKTRSDAEVASYHMATLPWTSRVSHSVKPDVIADGSPYLVTVSM